MALKSLEPTVLNPLSIRRTPAVKVDQDGLAWRAVRSHRSIVGTIFFGLFLVPWTAGCVSITLALFAPNANPQADKVPWLFPIPFWTAEIVIVGMFLCSLLGRETAELDEQGLRYGFWALAPFGATFVPRDQLVGFRHESKEVRGEDTVRTVWRVIVETRGRPVELFDDVAESEARSLADALTVAADRFPKLPPPDPNQPQPPYDTAWICERADDAFAFVERGRLNLGTCLGLTGVCAFWNGIVGVFVGIQWGWFAVKDQPQGGQWWFLFFFLIPFELIGAAILLAWLAAVAEPFRRLRWTFYRDRAERRWSYFGVGASQTFDRLDRLRLDVLPASSRIEAMVKQATGFGKPPPISMDLPPTDSVAQQWRLAAFSTDAETSRFEISGLSLGEAEWMGATLMRERPYWFESSGGKSSGVEPT